MRIICNSIVRTKVIICKNAQMGLIGLVTCLKKNRKVLLSELHIAVQEQRC